MAKTYFNQNMVWMHLKNEEELQYLKQLLEKSYLIWLVLGIEETDDPKLGKRLTIKIRRPGRTKYLYGEEYHEWEKIKRKVYAFRRAGS